MYVRAPLFLISGASWTLLALDPNGTAMPMYCSAATLGAMPSMSSVAQVLALNPPWAFAAGWALMLAAMMVPLLIAPVRHIRDRSFAARRLRAAMLFVAAYAAIWMMAGAVLLEIGLALRLVVPDAAVLVAAAAIVALVWQISPLKQRCLNRCHARPAMAAFGPAADIGALRYGLTHGIWCVGSCWLLMLLPLLVPGWHVAAMAAIGLLLFAERLELPARPRWQLRGLGKAARIVIAQARTRLHPAATL